MKKRTMFLLWLGAAISISEIYTGGLIAPLGLGRGMAAILLGHLIGVSLLAFGGYISFRRGQNAMEAVVFSLGSSGGKLVALANVLQLIGWTVVMIVQAGSAFTSVFPAFPFALAALILAMLVLVWALLLGSPATKLNDLVVILLSLLCLLLFWESTGKGILGPAIREGMSMALAIELSIAMPVSWLPLIGDYTAKAEDKTCGLFMPFWGYFLGSCAMYMFGLYLAVATGGDIFAYIADSPLRYPACAVVVLSTVTTAFLDLYSAAISSGQLVKTTRRQTPILAIGLLAALIAVFFPVHRYGDILISFLSGIGMVFVPVYSLLFCDFWLGQGMLKSNYNSYKLATALAGMAGYWLFGRFEIWIPTLLCVTLVCVLYIPYALIQRR